ncbi:hypothetical protein L208DRAFT_1263472 [Tricholoma matsutake]|nr:hypothetical protein L208DRAFT_1263472 [Tricholoma matsutake 945]
MFGLGIGKGFLRVFSLDFPLLGVSPIPVLCSIILTSDFSLLEAEVALIPAAWSQRQKSAKGKAEGSQRYSYIYIHTKVIKSGKTACLKVSELQENKLQGLIQLTAMQNR